ncbi:MAG: PDZ domain-containing protein [bacterium]|nr:PDZ domain-containing protein [bacterium]
MIMQRIPRIGLSLLLLVLLLPPTGGAQALTGPGEYRITSDDGAIRIPFEMFRDDIRMIGEINGQEVRMLIDNGTLWDQLLFFGSPRVDSLGFTVTDEIEVGGSGDGDPVPSDVAEGITLGFPGVEFTNQTAIITRYDPDLPNMWEGAEGQVSATFLSHFVVDINFDTMIMTLIEPDKFRYTAGGVELTMQTLAFNCRGVPIKLTMDNGEQRELVAMMDLGLGSPLWCPIGETEDVTLPERNTATSLGFGMQGEITGYLGRMAAVEIGGYRLDEVLTGFHDHENSGLSGDRPTIGMSLLNRFNLVLDYPGDRLFIDPNGSFDTAVERDMTGMTLRRGDDSELRVVQVTPDTPAAEAGLRTGDIITHINNRLPAEYERTAMRALLRQEGAAIDIDYLRDGRKRKATLKLRRLI